MGEDEEKSIVKLYNKMYANPDLVPPGASPPLIKPRSIDDVPIPSLTLRSDRLDGFTLRRIAAQLDDQIKDVADGAETRLLGGERRQVRILLDPARLAARHMAPAAVAAALTATNRELRAGSLASGNREVLVQAARFLERPEEIGRVVVAAPDGRPVYLRDVAQIVDGPEEPRSYVLFGVGKAASAKGIAPDRTAGQDYPAVTISVAKRKGTNAVVIADKVLAKVASLRGVRLPHEVQVTVTRNDGETAQEKSNELLKHLLLATVSVTILIAPFLGWRSAAVVLLALPVTLVLTLFLYFVYGYTLNRATLFALIFSIGILVDGAIVVVENIARHFHLPENRGRPLLAVAVEAVAEVGNPTLLVTWAVIAAILPMAFVGGRMGPYMRPIPVGASVAMPFSRFIAFMLSPWAAHRMLRSEKAPAHVEGHEDWTTCLYRRIMRPLIASAAKRWAFLAGVLALLLASAALVNFKLVHVKMLPFDNKSEFPVIVDMPEGTTLEQTARVTREIGECLSAVPEGADYQMYVGTAAPYHFSGLVRHYFLHQGPHQAGLQVMGANGRRVPPRAVVRPEAGFQTHNIYRKNLKRAMYVTGDMAGAEESPVYAILNLNRAIAGLRLPGGYAIQPYSAEPLFFTDKLAMKWDGEWHITVQVFRDLGPAFAAVLILIYVLVVGWSRSCVTPLTVMAPLPLTLVRRLPAHGLLGAFVGVNLFLSALTRWCLMEDLQRKLGVRERPA